MDSFLSVFDIFSRIKNYDAMLRRLALYSTISIYIISYALRYRIPQIEILFYNIENSLPPIKIVTDNYEWAKNINISGFIIAFIVSVFNYNVAFHDKISDILRIRKYFDLNYILVPMAKLAGMYIDETFFERLKINSGDLMQTIFYRYTSSTRPETLVDRHDIQGALTAWCHFWTMLELVLYLWMGAIIALYFESSDLYFSFMLFSLFALLFLILQLRRLPRFAEVQFMQIMRDQEIFDSVKARFDAIRD